MRVRPERQTVLQYQPWQSPALPRRAREVQWLHPSHGTERTVQTNFPCPSCCCCCCVASVVSGSVRPQRLQPTRLPRPWDSPGKNTGVGCHFLLQCMKVKVKLLSCVQLFATPMDCSLPGSSVHGIFQARVLEWGAIAFSVSLLDLQMKPLGKRVLSAWLKINSPKLHLALSRLQFTASRASAWCN